MVKYILRTELKWAEVQKEFFIKNVTKYCATTAVEFVFLCGDYIFTLRFNSIGSAHMLPSSKTMFNRRKK